VASRPLETGMHEVESRLPPLAIYSLIDNAPSPNGLVLNLAENRLFVAITRQPAVWRVLSRASAHRRAYIFSGSANTYIALWPRTGLISLTTPSSPAVPD
jgi:hypothetical protein